MSVHAAETVQTEATLGEVQSLLRKHQYLFNEVLKKVEVLTQNMHSLQDLSRLPLKNGCGIAYFEQALVDEYRQGNLISYLCCQGGGNLNEVVTGILSKIMATSLAERYSWTGKGIKSCFKSLKLKTVLIESVKKNPEYANSTEENIAKNANMWFRNAWKVGKMRNEEEEENSSSENSSSSSENSSSSYDSDHISSPNDVDDDLFSDEN